MRGARWARSVAWRVLALLWRSWNVRCNVMVLVSSALGHGMNSNVSDSQQPQSQVAAGDILAGKYRVERVIGAGGMGVVVAATHLELDTHVALKFLLPEVQANPEIVARFSREARAAVQIKSEHVARTLDVGRLENGCPYIVMEYLDGSDLAQRIAERGKLPVAEAVRFTLHACDALSEAHALGIVHRDLKPSNLFLARRRDGTEICKILDFGISKLTPGSALGQGLDMTRTSSLMGSPLYMSPEQLVRARQVDPRADLWALGVTLYEALAGVQPFLGETLPELCTKIMTQPPTPLSDYRSDLPDLLTQAIMRCLEKDVEQRFQSIGEFANAIRPFALALPSGLDRGSMASLELANAGPGTLDAMNAVAAATANRTASTLNAWGQTNLPIPGLPTAKSNRLWLLLGAATLALAAPALYWALRSAPVASPEARAAAVPAESATTPSTPVASAAPSVAAESSPSTGTRTEAQPAPSVGGASTTPTQANAAAVKSPSVSQRTSAAAPSQTVKQAPRASAATNTQPPSQKDLFGDRN